MSNTHGCISSIDISIEEVFDALTNLDNSKASGLDNIGAGILKNSASIATTSVYGTSSMARGLGLCGYFEVIYI